MRHRVTISRCPAEAAAHTFIMDGGWHDATAACMPVRLPLPCWPFAINRFVPGCGHSIVGLMLTHNTRTARRHTHSTIRHAHYWSACCQHLTASSQCTQAALAPVHGTFVSRVGTPTSKQVIHTLGISPTHTSLRAASICQYCPPATQTYGWPVYGVPPLWEDSLPTTGQLPGGFNHHWSFSGTVGFNSWPFSQGEGL
jgi:hypothetical protein